MSKLEELYINPFYQCQLTDRTDIENLIQKCIYSYIRYGYYNYIDYDFYNEDKRKLPAFRISPDKSIHYSKTELYKEFVISFDIEASLIYFRFVDKYSQSKLQVEFNHKYLFPKDPDNECIFMIDFDNIKIATLVNILYTDIDWLRKTICSSMPFNDYFPSGSTWKHFKGYELTVIAVAKHTETGETLVVYECRNPKDENYVPSIWARPMSMFFEKINENKYPEHKGEYRITRMGDKL